MCGGVTSPNPQGFNEHTLVETYYWISVASVDVVFVVVLIIVDILRVNLSALMLNEKRG